MEPPLVHDPPPPPIHGIKYSQFPSVFPGSFKNVGVSWIRRCILAQSHYACDLGKVMFLLMFVFSQGGHCMWKGGPHVKGVYMWRGSAYKGRLHPGEGWVDPHTNIWWQLLKWLMVRFLHTCSNNDISQKCLSLNDGYKNAIYMFLRKKTHYSRMFMEFIVITINGR